MLNIFLVLSHIKKGSTFIPNIGLQSNTATPLALFGGYLLIELRNSSVKFRTNRAIVLKSSSFRIMTFFLQVELT